MSSVRNCPFRADFDALDRLIAAIPKGATFDMTGYLDAKRDARAAVRSLMLRVQHRSASGPSEPLVAGARGVPVFATPTRRRPRP